MKQRLMRFACIAISAITIATMTSCMKAAASETSAQTVQEDARALQYGASETPEAALTALESAPWEAMRNYAKGDIVSFKNVYYECIQPHQSQEGWEPESTPALWAVYTGEVPDPGPAPSPGDVAVTQITLNKSDLKLEAGKTEKLTALVLPEDATDKTVTWKSSDQDVATVKDGMVKAVSAGTAVITASAGAMQADCTVTVTKDMPAPPPDASSLPGRVLTGYWQNFDNGAVCLKLADVPADYHIICVAFAEATSTEGEITFVLDSQLSTALGGYTTEDFKKDIVRAHEKGQKVILSIGGEVGNVTINSEASAKAFSESAYDLMQEYGFDGVDVDLEHGINVTYLSDSLHQLAEKAGPGFILTMAPQTMDIYTYDATYLKLARECADILTIMNTQYYNSGGMPGYDGDIYSQGTVGFLTSLAATQLESGVRSDQAGLGLPAVPRAAGGGWQEPANVAEAIESLVYGTEADGFLPPRAYNNFRGAMTWSINWDATNDYSFAKTITECFAKLPPIETAQ